VLHLRDASTCRFQEMSLGEVMLRLDPGDHRIRTTRSFHVWEGGGEYNVARGLRRCFGLRTAIITALVENDIGRLVEDLMLQGGVSTEFVQWVPFDGIGMKARVGLNFTERGYGLRGAVGVSDRAHSAASQMPPDAFDWNGLFGEIGTQWLHTGGIYAALSPTSAETAAAAMQAARRHGTIVSFDLNYRPSLWQDRGGKAAAQEVNRALVNQVDVLIGNEEDFSACLGYEVPGLNESLSNPAEASFETMIDQVAADYPNVQVIATTLRGVRSASVNDWSALGWSRTDGLQRSRHYEALEIFDRVGGGDSFASGLIFGLMNGTSLEEALNYGAAHGALAMTTPGDTSMATRKEVEHVMKGGSSRVVR
jgi:2-dehydro-3-deoxygluconokinase